MIERCLSTELTATNNMPAYILLAHLRHVELRSQKPNTPWAQSLEWVGDDKQFKAVVNAQHYQLLKNKLDAK